jgi:DNA helicase-4
VTAVVGAIIVAIAAISTAPVWVRRRSALTEDDLTSIDAMAGWAAEVHENVASAERDLRWITRDRRSQWEADRPAVTITATARKRLTVEQRTAYDFLTIDLRALVESVNGRILERTLTGRQGFLDSIESQPLTREQATAVITMDNRVQVVAAAGSGKTSVMVARAAYAIRYDVVKPRNVLLLAFNRAAAEELQTRI